jgi:hypothetical protein
VSDHASDDVIGGTPDIPRSTRDSNGLLVNLSETSWRLNDTTFSATINWKRLAACEDEAIRSLKSYVVTLIERKSSRHACNAARFVGDYLISLVRDDSPSREISLETLVWYRTSLQLANREWQFHHVRAWYDFCADRAFPGFDDDTLFTINEFVVPGNEKGVAVLSADPELGPLNEFEEAALRRALISDRGPIRERAALWLALAFGSNPANLSLLWETDFVSHHFKTAPSVYFLEMPRIKKRMAPRAAFKTRSVDGNLAAIIEELMESNKSITIGPGRARPLFVRPKPRPIYANTALEPFAHHFTAGEITESIQRCVRRLDVMSPRTGKPLVITTRRLRYTFACKMVRQGVTEHDLADLLDHTDTQHVIVYYNADSGFVERLDETIAIQLGPYIKAFSGAIVDRASSNRTVDLIPYRDTYAGYCGAGFICGLSVPRNCYTCFKFRPRKDGPHREVLTDFVQERTQLIVDGNERMAQQLDETIFAVGEVVALVESAKPEVV